MNKNEAHIDEGLLLAYLLGEADQQQIDLVKEWLDQSEKNVQYLNNLEQIWVESGKLTPNPVVVDKKIAWNKVSSRIDDSSKTIELNPPARNKVLPILIRVAAIFILVFGILSIYKMMNDTEPVLISSTTEVVSDTLVDGSIISLNKNSSLSYNESFNENIREVELKGEAYFDVKRDESKEFIIHAGEVSIKVLGTSFNVKAYTNKNETEVSVTSGKVMFYNVNATDTNYIVLLAGEKGIFDKSANTIVKLDSYNENEIFWQSKTLDFEQTKLNEVVLLLESIYDVSIEIDDQIKDCLLTTTFKNEKIEVIIQIIKESFNLKVSFKNNKYVLDGEGC